MKNSLFIFTLLSTLIFAACESSAPQVSYCYQVDETLVIITPEAEELVGLEETVSIDTVTIVDELGEQVTYGEIRDGRFYYGDGSSLAFSDQEIMGYGGLIEGLSGPAVTCP